MTKRLRITETYIHRTCEKRCRDNDYRFCGIKKFNKAKSELVVHCMKCEYGHIWKIRYGNYMSGRCCSKCPHAKQERKISEYLKKNDIPFIAQKTFDGCVNLTYLRFDFYIPQYNVCIEYDGKQHYESIDFFGGVERFEERQKNDKIKTDYCISNNITLYRIRYDQNTINELKNIIDKETNKGICNE